MPAAPGWGEAGGNCASGKVSSPTWGGGYGYDSEDFCSSAPSVAETASSSSLISLCPVSIIPRRFSPSMRHFSRARSTPRRIFMVPRGFFSPRIPFSSPPRRRRKKAAMANPDTMTASGKGLPFSPGVDFPEPPDHRDELLFSDYENLRGLPRQKLVPINAHRHRLGVSRRTCSP